MSGSQSLGSSDVVFKQAADFESSNLVKAVDDSPFQTAQEVKAGKVSAGFIQAPFGNSSFGKDSAGFMEIRLQRRNTATTKGSSNIDRNNSFVSTGVKDTNLFNKSIIGRDQDFAQVRLSFNKSFGAKQEESKQVSDF